MADYLVRASALQGVRTTVEKLGGDADALLRRTGLIDAEQDLDFWISYRSYLLLLEEAARSSSCQHFGLLLSQQQDIGILGALGFVIQQAPDLRTPIQAANPQLHQVLIEHLGNMQLNFGDNYCDKIRHLINQALTTGDCSIERVATFLAINKRTLQRQLKAQGTNYQSLLEEVRFDITQRYLRESNGSLTTLADMLCYSQLSVFSNAFRQRYGMSPREWKNRQAAS